MTEPTRIPRCSDIYRAGCLKDRQLAQTQERLCCDCRHWHQNIRHQPMWGDCRGDVPDAQPIGDEWGQKPRPTQWDHSCAKWEAMP
jgi:hypothetical protein